jgi:hypothetical protein
VVFDFWAMAAGFFWESAAMDYGFEFEKFGGFLEMWKIGVMFAFGLL